MPSGPDVQVPGRFGGSIESLNSSAVPQISQGPGVVEKTNSLTSGRALMTVLKTGEMSSGLSSRKCS